MHSPSEVANAADGISSPASTRSFWLCILLLFSLWDFYLPGIGIRPFDLIGCLGIGLYLSVWHLSGRQLRINAWAAFTCLAAVILVWYAGMRGVTNAIGNLRPTIGVFSGAMVLCALYLVPISVQDLRWAVIRCIAIHVLFFWIQLAVFLGFGEVLEYHAMFGASARVFAGVFRASGLLLEPAHFSLTMYMLLSLYIATGPARTSLLLVGCATMIASLSVWGLFAAVLLLAFGVNRAAKWWLGITTAILVLVVFSQFGEWWRQLWLLDRVLNLASDSSALARYGGLTEVGSDTELSELFFGVGITNEYLSLGSSGAAFILRAFGFLGSLALLGPLLLSSLPAGGKRVLLLRVLIVGLALSAAPLWTYMIWWAWIALIARGTTLASGPAAVA